VLKNKNDLETTASRKPLFHEKPKQTRKNLQSLKTKIKPKTDPLACPAGLYFGFTFAAAGRTYSPP
jgi:hypothetical protein